MAYHTNTHTSPEDCKLKKYIFIEIFNNVNSRISKQI